MTERADDPETVVDLTDGAPSGEVLRLDTQSPFERLSEKERVRLIVRVLCELVAYDELEGDLDAISA